MRKINLLWLMGILMMMPICFTSCSDDDDGPASSSDLIGMWEGVSYIWIEKENGEVVDEGEDDASVERFRFNDDGTCEYGEYYNGKLEWYDDEKGTWSYKNGKLIIRSDEYDDVETYTVKTLTASKMVLAFSEKWKEDGITYEDYVEMEFRKISD